MAALSAVSPYNPLDTYVVALDAPPSWAHPFGTTSRGQDTFWMLTFAMRNTLLFGLAVAILSRIFSLAVGLVAGYLGGWTDRVLMSINDTFIVIPLFPLLVLFYFVMRDYMSWALLALVMACLGWAYDARLIRSMMMSLKTREFTRTAVFSGMPAREIMLKEHLPFVLPIVFSTTLNNINWSIGLEVTLSVLGFTDLDTPTVGTMLFWANQHSAMVSGVWWWYVFPTLFITLTFIGLFLLAVSLNEYIDPRSRLLAHGRRVGVTERGRAAGPAGPRPAGLLPDALSSASTARCARSTTSRSTSTATRSTALPGSRAPARPPSSRRSPPRTARRSTSSAARSSTASSTATSTRSSEAALAAVRWKHLSYIMQGSMNVLNPVRRVRHTFVDFAFRHIGQADAGVQPDRRRASRAAAPGAVGARRLSARASGGMRQRVTIALATICRPEFIIADEPTTALDVVVQKDVLALMREIQREMGSSILFVTHDMSVHANMADRLGIMYAGRLVEEAPTRGALRAAAAPLHAAPDPEPAADRRRHAAEGAARRAAEPLRAAARLPLPSALPAGDGHLPGERPALTTLAPGHRVACFAASPAVQARGTTSPRRRRHERRSAQRRGGDPHLRDGRPVRPRRISTPSRTSASRSRTASRRSSPSSASPAAASRRCRG